MAVSFRVLLPFLFGVCIIIVALIAFVPSYFSGVDSVAIVMDSLMENLRERLSANILENFVTAAATARQTGGFVERMMDSSPSHGGTLGAQTLLVLACDYIFGNTTRTLTPRTSLFTSAFFGMVQGGNSSFSLCTFRNGGPARGYFNGSHLQFTPVTPVNYLPLPSTENPFPFNFRTRPWFVAGQNRTSWVPLYALASGNFAAVSIATPLLRNTTLMGVFAAEMRATDISKILGDLRIGKTGVGVVFQPDGNVAGNSWGEDVVLSSPTSAPRIKTMSNISNPIYNRIRHRLWDVCPPVGQGFKESTVDDLRVSCGMLPLKDGLQLYLLIVLPENDFLGDIKTNLTLVLIIVSLVIAFFVIVLVIGVRVILNPFVELPALLQQASGLEETKPLEKTNVAEVDAVAESFYRMVQKLHQLRSFVPHSLFEKPGDNSIETQSHGSSDEGSADNEKGGTNETGAAAAGDTKNPLAGQVHGDDHGVREDSTSEALSPVVIGAALIATSTRGRPAAAAAAAAATATQGGASKGNHGGSGAAAATTVSVGPDIDFNSLMLGDDGADLGGTDSNAMVLSSKRVAESLYTFRKVRCTLLYVDIGSVSATGNKSMLSQCMESIIGNVIKQHGIIDQLSSDVVIATFNAHKPCFMHETAAVTCALEISKAEDLPIYCVIDTTQMEVGTFGARGRLVRSVVGESVQLCDKIASLTQYILHARVVTTERAARSVSGVNKVPLDYITVSTRFRSESVDMILFEVRRSESDTDASYKRAFGVYMAGNVAEAKRELVAIKHCNHAVRLLRAIEYMQLHEQAKGGGGARADATRRSPPGLLMRKERLGWSELGTQPTDPFLSEMLSGTTETLNDAVAVRNNITKQKDSVVENDTGLFSIFSPTTESESTTLVVAGRGNASGSGGNASGTSDATIASSTAVVITDLNGQRWYRSERELGRGAFGTIYLALGPNGSLAAMKLIPFSVYNDTEALIAEVATLSTYRHPNIISYFGCAVLESTLAIITEYAAGGNLKQLLSMFGQGVTAPTIARRFIDDIVSGLDFLHEKGVVHSDIKLENALVDSDGVCKLADFGSVVQDVNYQQRSGGDVMTKPPLPPAGGGTVDALRGTHFFMAPEVAAGSQPTTASDVWGLGLLMIQIWTGRLPWSHKYASKPPSKFVSQLATDAAMVPDQREGVPLDFLHIIVACCHRTPSERPTVKEVAAMITAL